jgi:hypothetical protein
VRLSPTAWVTYVPERLAGRGSFTSAATRNLLKIQGYDGTRLQTPLNFDVYGYRFSIRGAPAEAVENVAQDFAFFAAPDAEANVTLELFDQNPPPDGMPVSDAVVYTPRNVVYRSGGRRYIDYHGRAMGIQEERTGNLKLYSQDPSLIYEAAYLYLLSQVGRHLDQRGLHRIHALGVVIRNRAVLVLLPMGGGKSTLGLHLMNYPEVRILSDDSPFLDRQGRAFAFPLRLGLLPGSEDSVPAEYRRVIQRMEFGPKHLVNYAFFKDRVCASGDPGLVLIGARTLGRTCRIEELGTFSGLRACIANCVVGVGLFQGMEFILQSSGWELLKHLGTGISRFRNCAQLVRRSRVCRVHLGADSDLNARTVLHYASQLDV